LVRIIITATTITPTKKGNFQAGRRPGDFIFFIMETIDAKLYDGAFGAIETAP
jgi:hypothetical protein